ncbi:MAG: tRNA lysidine(34) synthetase TilS [Erysipelotrichaceae bacterium]|nr:tRNA lysidine(34) synthetase TilS [Erysipelotrichaceae bacterium]
MKKIIIGCSGGPDSMALLDMLEKTGKYEIGIAHVNYQKRESAQRDEEIVKQYAEKHGLKMWILYPQWNHEGNFQAWARDVRYDFFVQCAKEFDTEDLFIAHQLDDHIETYYFQKQRQMVCDTFGLAKNSVYRNLKVHRPLLGYEKKELEQYCQNNHVPYGIDESNLTDDYTRNTIRHHQTEALTKKQKLAICEDIEDENKQMQRKREEARAFLKTNYTVDELIRQKEAWLILDVYLYEHTQKHYAKKHLCSLVEQLHTDCLISLGEFELERWQNHLICQRTMIDKPVILNTIEYKDYGSFKLSRRGKTIEGVTLKASDFPITIRPVQSGDSILLRYGRKKLSRFFIDRKIPRYLRKQWLVMENKDKEIIFVPGIGCDVNHFSIQPTLFMLK